MATKKKIIKKKKAIKKKKKSRMDEINEMIKKETDISEFE